MKSQPTVVFLLFIILGLFVFSHPVTACSCARKRSVCEAFGNAEAVFVGKAINAKFRNKYKGENGKEELILGGEIYFEVQEAFSGVKGQKRVTIHSGMGGGDCGMGFVQNETYLIYAYGKNSQSLSTGICTRTRPFNQANEDLAFLRNLPPEGSGARLYGQVEKRAQTKDKGGEMKMEGIPAVTIRIKNSLGEIQTIETDQQGKYEITGLKPGEYKVEADLPEGYKKGQYKSEQEFSVKDRGCTDVSFWAQPDNRISGRIMDAEGAIPKKVKLVLIEAGKKEIAKSLRNEVGRIYFNSENEWNKDGRFEFGWIETLESGEYLLGVNITDNPDEDSPYPPTYYPGVKDRAQAAVLKVELGTVIDDIVFQLPSKLHKHKIRGIVIWPDGRPVAKAEVYLQDESRPGWSINGFQETDAQGRFTLTGYTGFNYEIVAEVEKYPNAPEGKKQEMEAEPFKITLANDVAGIKIILNKEKKKKDE